MFWKYAEFWIKNPKLTIILMIVISLWWLLSWYIIPKQYNPDIEMPAFVISTEAPWYSAEEVNNLIVSHMEKKFYEIEWVDDVRWTSMDNFWSAMVTFEVWTDKEAAITRLYNKIYSSLDLKPYWVEDPDVMPIDPDEIPIYSFAIYNPDKDLSDSDNLLRLKEITYDIIDELKLIDDTTLFYNIWWYANNLNINFDLDRLSAYNLDIAQIIESIKDNNKNSYAWEFSYDNVISDIQIKWSLEDKSQIKNIVVAEYNWENIYLWDIADIDFWITKKDYHSLVSSSWDLKDAAYIWISKLPQANSIFVVDDIKSKLESLETRLPDWYKIKEIQDEWYTAQQATNMLMTSLFQAIFIVFIVLLFYLGFRDAINNSIAIPLALAIVFGIALMIWDNVNRITLFAIILVLWMLVDNSTVIVENISRHLSERYKKWINKLDAIKNAVNEVWVWVILATITRILAFVAMFFVTDMMGEYMWPIPQYAIIALTASFFIAMSVNPFFAYFFEKDKPADDNKKKSISEFDSIAKDWAHEVKQTWIEKKYKSIMTYLLDPDKPKRRRNFKRIFWLSLFAIMIVPIFLQIFKAQMLPKSNQDQIYVWIDAPRDWSISKTQDVMEEFNFFLDWFSPDSEMDSIPNDLKIVDNSAHWVWIEPMPDFATVFRGSFERQWESQISSRINFVWKWNRDISSQDFVIKFRPILKEYLLSKYPELEIRVLEEPPWPPVQATFKLKVQWNPGQDYEKIWNLANWIQDKINPSLKNNEVVDIYNTYQDYKTTYKIDLDHEKLNKVWLDIEQVSMWLYSIFEWLDLWVYHDPNSKYQRSIILQASPNTVDDVDVFEQINFVWKDWNKIALIEVADIIAQEKSQNILNDDMYPSVYIYWEMAEDSVVYPSVALFNVFLDSDFWQDKFEVLSWNPYWFELKEIATWDTYYIKFGGEREVTMDTFADLWLAMIIALLGIYFIMVSQFKSFSIAWIIMITFLLGFFGVFPWFSTLYILNWEFFSATSMIWVIALAWIVVGNAIILIEYMNVLLKNGLTIKSAILKAWLVRLRPIIITSLTTVLWVTTILWDPVWSGLALAIIFWLSVSAVLTLIVIPVFLYENLSKLEDKR